ncbi:MAG: metallophosphoesterase family protein [Candidatus Cloacimonetes bacterium]|nr:metallophosphoesterase family protein [Candidatus Cloacimonadota bacterium]
MQKVLVISDTHGNQRLMRSVMQKEKELTHIVHLGDFYEDIEYNNDLTDGKVIIRVPGVFHPGYYSQQVPFYQTFKVEKIKISCVHAYMDIKRIPVKGNIILFGHTHQRELFKKEQNIYINPGHLKNETDRGYKASYCVIEIKGNTIKIIFRDYMCNLIEEFPLEIINRIGG